MLPAFLLTCPQRAAECRATLADWALSDWGAAPHVFVNPAVSADVAANIRAGFRELLRRALATGAERFLLVEDDIRIHRHLRRLVESWPPLARLHLGSLYDPGLPRLATFPAERCFHADPAHARGAQARLFSRPFAQHAVAQLADSPLRQDQQIARLAAPFGPLYVHTPSLIQHVGEKSTWGGIFHRAWDFAGEEQASDRICNQLDRLKQPQR